MNSEPAQEAKQAPVATTSSVSAVSTVAAPVEAPKPATAAPALKPPASMAQMRPLNVKDALGYLDEVKIQFTAQPEVYNKFLDIMKDFKMQVINTPGVIDRVSNLFRGHPLLIQGFNTFLPPGYRIDVSANPNETSLITITTPTGTVTRTQSGPSGLSLTERLAGVAKTGSSPAVSPAVPTSAAPEGKSAYSGYTTTPAEKTASASQPPPISKTPSKDKETPTVKTEPRESNPGLHLNQLPAAAPSERPIPGNGPPVATPGAASILGIQGQPVLPKPAVEFNHAISYVNKIKTRFQNEPQIYKIFLEILQTYQKEARPIQDVYAQVTQLFSAAPDLLEEFKQFLPDPALANAPPGTTAAPYPPYVDNSWQAGRSKPGRKRSPVYGATLTAAAQGQEDKRRKKLGGASASATGASLAANSRGTKRPRAPIITPDMAAVTPPPGSSMAQAAQSPYPKGSHGLPGQTLATVDELGFFDRAKRHVGDKQTHQEFLKLLNLYTQEHINLHTLVEKMWLFLGSDEDLFSEFKTLVGWDQTEHGFVEGEELIVDNVDALERPRLDLNALKSHGPSYKRLPQTEVDLACSGRDPLCWSVLNDEWVAHATWATEGSGAHRKNPSEEALMYSEQERHWFSVTMETNTRAIAILEPQLHRINIMDSEQKEHFHLSRGFTNTNASVVERAIKRVYGSEALGAASGTRQDHAKEVIRALYDSPALAIPTIVARLKQKAEDWTRALREWNKVWREVDCKNYYRSLDHQGVTFKANDKKTTGAKNLVAEIEQLRNDQKKKRVYAGSGSMPQNSAFPLDEYSPHQYELRMDDKTVIFDVMRLIIAYLDRQSGGVSAPERQRVEGFLRLFVPMVFGVTKEEVHEALGHFEVKQHDDDFEEAEIDAESDGDSEMGTVDGDGPASNGTSSTVNNRRPGPKAIAADLRRRLLSRSVNVPQPSALAKESQAKLDQHERELAKENVWIVASSVPHTETPPSHKRRRSSPRKSSPGSDSGLMIAPEDRRQYFFANNVFYCLIRTFHMLYHRLQTLKIAAQQLADSHEIDRLNPLAVELGLVAPLPIIDTPALKGRAPAEAYYLHLLELCERMFDGEIDSSAFEESLRLMWGIKAFPMYTVDRMVSSVIKHAHTINNDAASQDLLLLLERDRSQQTTMMRQQIAHRMEAEKLQHDRAEAEKLWGVEDHTYRIEWIPEGCVLAIQLLGKSDLTMDDHLNNSQERFEYYVSSYALADPTEGVGHHVKAPVLKRNHRIASKQEHPVRVRNNAEVRIGQKTFKLFHVGDTGDEICLKEIPLEETTAVEENRSKRFEEWLGSSVVERMDIS